MSVVKLIKNGNLVVSDKLVVNLSSIEVGKNQGICVEVWLQDGDACR